MPFILFKYTEKPAEISSYTAVTIFIDSFIIYFVNLIPVLLLNN
jgi:hypothetical protein